MRDKVLIILRCSQRIVRASNDSVLGVILDTFGNEPIAFHELFVFFWEMSTSQCSSVSFLLSVHSFLEPVGHQSPWVICKVPWPCWVCLLYESIWVGLCPSISVSYKYISDFHHNQTTISIQMFSLKWYLFLIQLFLKIDQKNIEIPSKVIKGFEQN